MTSPASFNSTPVGPFRPGFSAAALAILALIFSGCVSPKYRLLPAANETVAGPALNLAANPSSTLHATVDSVIIFHGPGSWKQEAYWDEYLITLTNHGDSPVRVESAVLADFHDQPVVPGADPWLLEETSKNWWTNARDGDAGRLLLLGGGAGAAGAFGLSVANAATMVGAPAAFTAATTVAAMALPVYAAATVVRNIRTRQHVEAEFQRRRLDLPLYLAPGETMAGSLFFRVSPAPRRLALRAANDTGSHEVLVDLGSLAGLHRQASHPTPRPVPAYASERPREFSSSAAPVFSLQ
jgi:hypothetical protein